MGVLQRFERRLEAVVEGAFARAFRGHVEPVEIGGALQREMADRKAILGAERVLVPNDYVVELSPTDHDRLAPYAQPLRREFGTLLREHAGEQGWSMVGEPIVTLVADDTLSPGVFRVRSAVTAPPETPHAPPPPPRPEPVAHQPAGPRWRHVFPGAPRLVVSAGGRAEQSSVEAEGGSTALELIQPVTVIGRGNDVDLRLLDPNVSRRHAEVRVGPDGVTITDLGSTNGTLVNDSPITGPTPLRPGMRILLGGAVLVYDRDPLDPDPSTGA